MGAEQGKMQAGGRRGPPSPSGTGSVDASLQKRLQHGVAYNMKVIIRGAPRSGKTQLFRRLQAKTFDEAYTPTSQLQSATIHWSYNGTTPGMGGDNSTKVEVWDVVDKGQARESPKATGLRGKAKSLFGSKDPPVPNMVADASSVDVYKNTHVVVLMFDITKPETWEYVTKILPDVPPAIHVLILANCHDLADTGRQVEESSIEEFARDQSIDRRKQGDGRVFKLNTSMKDCFGLSELYQYLSVPFLCLKRASLMETVKLLTDKIEETDREFGRIVGDQNYPAHLEKLEEGIARSKPAAPPPPEPHPSNNLSQGEADSSPDAIPESPAEPTTRVKSVSFSSKPQENKNYDESNFYDSVDETSDESADDRDSDSMSSDSDNGMVGFQDDFENQEAKKAERKQKEKERLEKQKKREEKERQRKAQEKEERKKREAEERARLKAEQAKQEEEKKKQEEEEKEKENENAERKAKFELVAASVDVGDEGMDDFWGGDVEEEGEGDVSSRASVQEEEEVVEEVPVRRRGMSEVIDDPVEAPVVRARGLSSMSRQSSAPGEEGSNSQSDLGSDPDMEGAAEFNEDFFDTFGEEQQAKPVEAPAPAPASAVDAATLAAIEAMKKQMEQEAADAEANKSNIRPSYSGRLPKEKKEKKPKKEKGENGEKADKPKKPKKDKGEKAAKEPKEPGEKKKKKSEKGEKKEKLDKKEKSDKKKKSKKGEE